MLCLFNVSITQNNFAPKLKKQFIKVNVLEKWQIFVFYCTVRYSTVLFILDFLIKSHGWYPYSGDLFGSFPKLNITYMLLAVTKCLQTARLCGDRELDFKRFHDPLRSQRFMTQNALAIFMLCYHCKLKKTSKHPFMLGQSVCVRFSSLHKVKDDQEQQPPAILLYAVRLYVLGLYLISTRKTI